MSIICFEHEVEFQDDKCPECSYWKERKERIKLKINIKVEIKALRKEMNKINKKIKKIMKEKDDG